MTRLEREQQVRKQKKVLYTCSIIIVLTLIVIVASKLNGNSLEAEAALNGNYVYESILVENGDTLWSIANENSKSYSGSVDEYIAEIKSVNNLYSDSITAGEYLLLPVYNSAHN